MEARDAIDGGPAASGRSAPNFETFFRTHYTGVVRIAYGIVGDSHTAQDVAQDVFIAAERRFPDPGQFVHAAAWIRVAAVHAGLNAVRGRRRRDARQAGSAPPVRPAGPEELMIERASQEEVRHALARLPMRSSTVLLLRHSGLSYAEVSEAMGVGIGQVGTMLRRAEAALRKELERASHS